MQSIYLPLTTGGKEKWGHGSFEFGGGAGQYPPPGRAPWPLTAGCPSSEKCATAETSPEATAVETVLSATFHSDVTILISHGAGGPNWGPGLVAGRGSKGWEVPEGLASLYTGLGDGEARRSSPSVPGKKTASLNKSRTPEPSWGRWRGIPPWMVHGRVGHSPEK